MLHNVHHRSRTKRAIVLESTFSHDLKTAAEIGTPALKQAVMKTVNQIAAICRDNPKYQPICGFNRSRRQH
jgi:hypothetical protein